MSTTTQEQETTMPPQTKEHQIYQSIKHYQLEDWVGTIPGGFRTLRLLSDWKIALLLIKLSAVLITLLKAYGEVDVRDLGWYTLLVVVCGAGVAFAFIFGLSRKVVFDLENDEVSVTLLGSPVSRKNLHDFTALSFRYENTLYIEFNDQSKIRIVNLGKGKVVENLERFILEALAMSEKEFVVQPASKQELAFVEKPDVSLTPAQNDRILTLDVLRSAVWDDTQNHNVKNMAELLITALNDWPRETLEIEATIEEMKAYFGKPLTLVQIKGKRFDYSMPYNSWRLEAGSSLMSMIELSTKLENESDFDQIVERILDYYGLRVLS